MEIRNLATGAIVTAHRVGCTESGRPVYRPVRGHEPTVPYICDPCGNWIAATESEIRAARAR